MKGPIEDLIRGSGDQIAVYGKPFTREAVSTDACRIASICEKNPTIYPKSPLRQTGEIFACCEDGTNGWVIFIGEAWVSYGQFCQLLAQTGIVLPQAAWNPPITHQGPSSAPDF